jgi:hypothetical protein
LKDIGWFKNHCWTIANSRKQQLHFTSSVIDRRHQSVIKKNSSNIIEVESTYIGIQRFQLGTITSKSAARHPVVIQAPKPVVEAFD